MREDSDQQHEHLDDETVKDPVQAGSDELTEDDLDEVAGGWDDTSGGGGGG